MTENTKIAIAAINKWFFFCMNYTVITYEWHSCGELKAATIPRFITEARWNCSVEHIISKWQEAISSQNPDAYLTRFYANLSNENRIALLEWVLNNYHDELPIIGKDE